MFDSLSFGAQLVLVGFALGLVEYFLKTAWARVACVAVATVAVILLGFAERRELQRQAATAQQETEAVTASLNEVQTSLNIVETRSNKQEKVSRSLLFQNDDLIKDLNAARVEREALLSELGRAQRNVESLEVKANTLTEQNDVLVGDLSEARRERQNLSTELSQARLKVEQLEAQISDIRLQNSDLANELLEARRELAEGFERADALNREIQSEQRQASRDAAKAAAAQALTLERNSYCEANKGTSIISSPELDRWGGRCCNGLWQRDKSRVCFVNN